MIGDAAGMALEEARCRARSILVTLHDGEEIIAATNEETLFEACQRHWKDSTKKVNRIYFRNQIPPWFRGLQIAGTRLSIVA